MQNEITRLRLAYRVVMTEYRMGFDQGPRGIIYTLDQIDMIKEVSRQELMWGFEYFSRSSPLTRCIVTDEFYEELQEKRIIMTAHSEHDGVIGLYNPLFLLF